MAKPGLGTRDSGLGQDTDRAGSHRRIRSFVTRGGRVTPGQQKNLDRLWPRYGLSTPRAPIDWPAVFGRDAPRTLEIGFGAGEVLVDLAAQHPQEDFIGIEVYAAGLGRALGALAAAAAANVRLFDCDAMDALTPGFESDCLDRVLLYFPDPWPKKRHHKRRLVQPAFVGEIARVLKPGGLWHLATDWANYAEHMRALLDAHPAFDNVGAADGWAHAPARAATRFETRGRRKGHAVFDMLYRRS